MKFWATCSYSFQPATTWWSNDIIWFTKTKIKVFAFPGSIYRVGYDLLLQIEVKTLGGRNDSRWNWSRWTSHKSAHHTWTEHTRLQMWFHWLKPASNTRTVPSEIHGPCGFRVYYCNELWSTWLSSPAVNKKCWVYSSIEVRKFVMQPWIFIPWNYTVIALIGTQN